MLRLLVCVCCICLLKIELNAESSKESPSFLESLKQFVYSNQPQKDKETRSPQSHQATTSAISDFLKELKQEQQECDQQKDKDQSSTCHECESPQ